MEQLPVYPEGYPPALFDPATFDEDCKSGKFGPHFLPFPEHPLSRYFVPYNPFLSRQMWVFIDAPNQKVADFYLDRMTSPREPGENVRFTHVMWRTLDGEIECMPLSMDDALAGLQSVLEDPAVQKRLAAQRKLFREAAKRRRERKAEEKGA